MTKHWSDKLGLLRACDDGYMWARGQPDAETAWASCPRGDWMAWALDMQRVNRRGLVLAVCSCLRAVTLKDLDNPEAEHAVVALEQWAHGDSSVTVADITEIQVDLEYDVGCRTGDFQALDAVYDACTLAKSALTLQSFEIIESIASAAFYYAPVDPPGAEALALKQCADILRQFWPTVPRRGS